MIFVDNYSLRFIIKEWAKYNIFWNKGADGMEGLTATTVVAGDKSQCPTEDDIERNKASIPSTQQLGLYIKILFICDLNLQCPPVD